MRTIFIADAHLVNPQDDNYRCFLKFLQELEGTVDSLYILGDLFDFWVGFPDNPFRHYDPVINALQRLVDQGCRLVYLEGNHDFHLGEVFTGQLKAEVHDRPISRELQGKRLYLCHGDQINQEDRGYRMLRSILRSWPVAASIRHFPPYFAELIRRRLQKSSRSGYTAKTIRWNYRDIILSFADQLCRQGYDALVTGHFHLALRENLQDRGFTVLALGDWLDQFTYGELQDGELHLKVYSPS